MEIPVALSALISAAQIGGAIVHERDSQKLAALKVDLTNKIAEAQAHVLQLLEAVVDKQRLVGALEQRVRELEAQAAEKQRYELAKLGTTGQFFAYRSVGLGESHEGVGQVAHFVCQPCFDRGQKVVLAGNGEGYWKCPACGHGAQTEPAGPSIRIGRRSSITDGY